MSMDLNQLLWVFNAEESSYPGGVFWDLATAERWIEANSLSGLLTAYPANQGVYDWAVERGFFEPTKPFQKTSKFIGRFSSAHLQHFHYESGRRINVASQQPQSQAVG